MVNYYQQGHLIPDYNYHQQGQFIPEFDQSIRSIWSTRSSGQPGQFPGGVFPVVPRWRIWKCESTS